MVALKAASTSRACSTLTAPRTSWCGARARSHYRFVLPLIHFIPDSLTYSVPLFLRRQRDRTLRQVRRIQERGKTSGRSDDNAEAMVKRLRVYHEETGPVIDHFDRLGQARPRRFLSKKS